MTEGLITEIIAAIQKNADLLGDTLASLHKLVDQHSALMDRVTELEQKAK